MKKILLLILLVGSHFPSVALKYLWLAMYVLGLDFRLHFMGFLKGASDFEKLIIFLEGRNYFVWQTNGVFSRNESNDFVNWSHTIFNGRFSKQIISFDTINILIF